MAYGTLKCDNIVFDNGGTDKLVTVSGLFFSTSGALTVTGTISGGNVTAPTATFTTLTGTTTAGTTATFTSGSFTSLTGVTTTGTTATFTSGSFTSLTGVTTTVTSGVFGLGSAASPSIAFSGDTNNGIYSPGADQVAISTNGTSRLAVSTTAVSSTLAVDHPLGTVGNPSVTFTGDTDTGFWSPAADTLAASTNGVEKLRILSDGKVGFGITAPNQQLHVKTDQAAATFARIDNQSSSGSAYAGVQLGAFGNTWGLAIGSASANSNALIFALDPNTSITAGEKMRLDSSGRLGLGTSSPGTSLDVRGIISLGSSSLANAIIQKSAVPGGSYSLTITSGAGLTSESATTPTDALAGSVIKLVGGPPATDDFGGGIGYYANGHTAPNAAGNGNQHVFYTRSAVNTYAERMRISAGGLVGIGTAAPTSRISVAGGTTQAAEFSITGNNNASGTGLVASFGAGGAGDPATTKGAYISIGASSVGNVYFGCDSSYPGIIRIKTDYPTPRDLMTFEPGGGFITFLASGSEKMRLDGSGRLLVGTTSSIYGARLTCVSVTGVSASAFVTDTASEYSAILRNAATSGNNGFALFETEATPVTRGSITYNRAGGVVAYNITSDYRAKTLLGAVENPGETIDALKVYCGVMNGATIERPMLIAHEAQEVAPYCVTGEKDAVDDDGNPIYQQMDHQVLVPLLIAEIQQLRARVVALEAA
jgi:hypothetical protein